MNRFWRRFDDHAFPNGFSIETIQTEQPAFVLLCQACSQEYTVLPDDRRRVAFAGDRCLPGDIFSVAPARGEVLFAADAVTAWSAPSGPVFRHQGSGQEED